MAIINPEKECKTAPEIFSQESVIVGVEKEDYKSGIILDNANEFAAALRIYSGAGGSARATRNAIISEQEGIAAVFMLFAEAVSGDISDPFTERLIEEGLSELETKGSFSKSFDYDAYGTNFFKTNVNGRKVDEKYVLELYSGHAGSKIEEELAKSIGKPLALVRSTAMGRLNIVDDWWFNVNLEEALAGLPISRRQLKSLPKYLTSNRDAGKNPEITFKHEGQKLAVSIFLDAEPYLRPEGGNLDSHYKQLRGKHIVGGAWATWEGSRKIAPKATQPAIGVSVSLPKAEWYSRSPPAVTEERMKLFHSARDYLAGLLKHK